MRSRCLLLLALLLFCNAPQAEDWSQLPLDIRALLEPVRGSWDRLPPEEAARIAGNARAWLDAGPEQREILRQRHQTWLQQPPTERAAARQRLQAWQSFDSAQQESVLAAAKRFAAMTPAEREQLTQRFRNMDAERQLAFLMPADQRAAVVMAQRLFPFVDLGQRDATLRMLMDLGADGRSLLERRARRMSPQQRELLRTELLNLSTEERQRRLAEG